LVASGLQLDARNLIGLKLDRLYLFAQVYAVLAKMAVLTSPEFGDR